MRQFLGHTPYGLSGMPLLDNTQPIIRPLSPNQVPDALQGTPDTSATLVQNVSVNHGRSDIFVSQQLLNRSNGVSILQQVSGGVVPKRVNRHMFSQSGQASRLFDSFSHIGFVSRPISAQIQISHLTEGQHTWGISVSHLRAPERHADAVLPACKPAYLSTSRRI